MLEGWWEAALDLLYPPKCPSCRVRVARHGAWCRRCAREELCEREIHVAGQQLKYLDGCTVLYEYEGDIKRLLQDMKFRKARRHAPYLGWLLDEYLRRRQPFAADMVVPVPLHAARQLQRGFNQTELIFRPVLEQREKCWAGVLIRVIDTRPQWELNLAERRQNIKGAFRVDNQALVAGKRILLVDDLFTSGVTMDECARTLKKAGAVFVYGLALASSVHNFKMST